MSKETGEIAGELVSRLRRYGAYVDDDGDISVVADDGDGQMAYDGDDEVRRTWVGTRWLVSTIVELLEPVGGLEASAEELRVISDSLKRCGELELASRIDLERLGR